MNVRYIIPADDRMMISKVYEESWKAADKGIIPQDYLDSIPEGRWAPHLDNRCWKTLVCIEDGKMIGVSSFCKSRFEQFPDWGEIISISVARLYWKRLWKNSYENCPFGIEKPRI